MDSPRAEAYETLVRNFPNGAVLLFDEELRHSVADGVGLAALGAAKETVEGRTLAEAFPPELAQVLEPAYRAALEGRPGDYELAYGDRVHALHVIPVRAEDGAPAAGMVVTQDVTQRKQEQNERELLLLVERLALADVERTRSELAAQNARLLELDTLKDEFLALVSHELRTPLTSIIGYLEYLVEGKVGEVDAEQARMLKVIERNANRLHRLVNDLLLVAQVEAGKLALATGDVDVEAVAAACVEAARPSAAAKELELTLESDGPVPLWGDSARLAQLVDNVLSNAIKFTPVGGRVAVRVVRGEREATLEVADSGPGVDPSEQERLFDRFYRTRAAARDAVPGSGLGLAIAKALAEGHGGRISVESASGEGATFRVALPVAAHRLERSAA